MTDFEIFTDSSANIPDELTQQRNIHVIPYLCTIDGEEFSALDGNGNFRENAKAFYAKMRAGADVKSSLIVEARFVEALSPVLKAGKDVLLITIASGISGTYNQALAAQKALKKLYPKQNVYVCDSANASLGEGLLVLKAADLRDMGMGVTACAEWMKNNAYKMNSYFTVDDLKYLRKGGRISRTAALAGTILNIKPLLTADGGTNAKLATYGKVRGRKKAITEIVNAFDKHVNRPEDQTVAIAHADCEEDAQELARILKEHGAGEVIIEYYDLCTGSHAGPGTLAVFFFGTDRRNKSPELRLNPRGKLVPEKP